MGHRDLLVTRTYRPIYKPSSIGHAKRLPQGFVQVALSYTGPKRRLGRVAMLLPLSEPYCGQASRQAAPRAEARRAAGLRLLRRRQSHAGLILQCGRLIGGFPGKGIFGPPEVAERGRLAIDGTPQAQRVDDGARRQLEVRPHQLRKLRIRNRARAERVHHHGHRFRHADGVRQLHLAARSQPARLAQAIARETGESLTKVVIESLRDRHAKVEKRKGKATLVELMAIAKRASRAVKRPYVEHGQLLYDEHGLPK